MPASQRAARPVPRRGKVNERTTSTSTVLAGLRAAVWARQTTRDVRYGQRTRGRGRAGLRRGVAAGNDTFRAAAFGVIAGNRTYRRARPPPHPPPPAPPPPDPAPPPPR